MASEPLRIVIVGGGISGLAAAHYAASRTTVPLAITLLEARGRLGGNIGTERQGGMVVDTGPDSIVTTKPEGTKLCEDLGLGPRLIETIPENRRVYIVRWGKLFVLPEGLLLGVPTEVGSFVRTPLISFGGKLRVGAEYLAAWSSKLGRRRAEDVSLGTFLRDRFGDEMSDIVLEPLLGGIYSGEATELSLRATFPQWFVLKTQGKSLLHTVRAQMRARRRGQKVPASKGELAPRSPFRALAGGMSELTETLVERLRGAATLRIATPVSAVTRQGRGFTVHLEGGEALAADRVVLAAPAHASGSILSGIDGELSGMLSAIHYASTVIVFVVVARAQVPHPLDASGFLIPMRERQGLIAGTFVGSKWPERVPDGKVLLRGFITGASESGGRSDADLAEQAMAEFRRLVGVTGEPERALVVRHMNASPQPRVGHADRVRRMGEILGTIPGLCVIGNAYDGIGIPDCARLAAGAVDAILGLA
jgi:protoporphyrinogen/coproporphyrinogen III oxidase